MYQRGPEHTGATSTADGPGEALSSRWEVTATSIASTIHDGAQVPLVSPPTVVDGTAYVALSSMGGGVGLWLVALDASDGTVSWKTHLLEEFVPTTSARLTRPTVVDDAVVVSAPGFVTGASVFAIDAKTGEERWRDGGDRFTVTSATARDGQFVFGASTAYALAADGSLAWEYAEGERPARSRVGFPPTVTADRVYVPSLRSLHALDREGNEQWVRDLDFEGGLLDSVSQPTTPVAGDAIYVISGNLPEGGDGKLLALDPADGTTRWEFQPAFDADRRQRMGEELARNTGRPPKLGVGVYSAPALWNGTLYALGTSLPEQMQLSSTPMLYAIDADSGTREWATRLPDTLGLTPPVIAGGTVYAATGSGLVAVDAESGDRLGSGDVFDGHVGGTSVVDDAIYASDRQTIAAIGP